MKFLTAFLLLTTCLFGQIDVKPEFGQYEPVTWKLGVPVPEGATAQAVWEIFPRSKQEFTHLSLADGEYLWGAPGDYVVQATVVITRSVTVEDQTFDVLIPGSFQKYSTSFKITGKASPPPPDDDKPSDVPNEYKVGLVAWNASESLDSAEAYRLAEIFNKAGDFLYGKPSLKFIVSDDDPKNSDPNRSVKAWIKQQVGSSDWLDKVEAALTLSQSSRQYTREDWYKAFQEVSTVMGMRANVR